ncbi:Fur family transcriptional regulator [Ameyamaea chiangmaiensis NBRC 103196]|uniref:Fur family transcriptional regulator n=1 Tax=Ameyamaea chiangmaiensis TaxID=442969 RepID=UPI00215672FD|nr:Fur family transcriptional regulator [Ameyamaea chiangmaiensis]GBQ63231.1 Fur family transcriptional regulator [Ameyamaea chiangmaiensis NBRC 103196]
MDTSVAFSPRIERLLDQASSVCAERGSRLTDIRRLVLGLVLDRGRPSGAYELLDRLRENNRGAAPPTVYRALDFLLEQGLVHRIERLSAFVACTHALEHAHGCSDFHAAQFLICRHCGEVTELENRGISHALRAAGAEHGFHISASTIEAEGTCAACRAKPAGMDGPAESRQ